MQISSGQVLPDVSEKPQALMKSSISQTGSLEQLVCFVFFCLFVLFYFSASPAKLEQSNQASACRNSPERERKREAEIRLGASGPFIRSQARISFADKQTAELPARARRGLCCLLCILKRLQLSFWAPSPLPQHALVKI